MVKFKSEFVLLTFMTLFLIGIGLFDEKDITVRGLEAVKKCKQVYLENYTSILGVNVDVLEKFYGKKIILADRNLVEKKADQILDNAKSENTAFLIIGDVFGATTHTDIFLRAKEKKIDVKIINNASILNAIGIVGLELYKYGKTTSLPFFDDNWKPQTAYDVIKENHKAGLHTLCLLDIKVAEPKKEDIKKGINKPLPPRFMTVNQAIKQLLEIESERKEKVFSENTKLIGCARIGSENPTIIYGKASDLLKKDFGQPLHSIIIPGKLHFVEEEMLSIYEK